MFVAGLPLSKDGHKPELAPTCLEDFPSCLDFAARLSGCYLFAELLSARFLLNRLDMAVYIPHETCKLTGNGGDDLWLRLSDCRKSAVSLAQPRLCLPADGPDPFTANGPVSKLVTILE